MSGEHRPPEPVGLYAPFVRHGDLVTVSAISTAKDGQLMRGKVGRDLDLGAARLAAARAAANLLAVLRDAAGGDLGRVEKVMILRGYVNATEDFERVHHVVDAASEAIVAALGEERGSHARTALGLATLPNGNSVTLEAMAVVKAE